MEYSDDDDDDKDDKYTALDDDSDNTKKLEYTADGQFVSNYCRSKLW